MASNNVDHPPTQFPRVLTFAARAGHRCMLRFSQSAAAEFLLTHTLIFNPE
jgi:hypothetical protein